MPGIFDPDRTLARTDNSHATLGPPPFYETPEFQLALYGAIILTAFVIAWRTGCIRIVAAKIRQIGSRAMPYWRELIGFSLLTVIAFAAWR